MCSTKSFEWTSSQARGSDWRLLWLLFQMTSLMTQTLIASYPLILSQVSPPPKQTIAYPFTVPTVLLHSISFYPRSSSTQWTPQIPPRIPSWSVQGSLGADIASLCIHFLPTCLLWLLLQQHCQHTFHECICRAICHFDYIGRECCSWCDARITSWASHQCTSTRSLFVFA